MSSLSLSLSLGKVHYFFCEAICGPRVSSCRLFVVFRCYFAHLSEKLLSTTVSHSSCNIFNRDGIEVPATFRGANVFVSVWIVTS